MQFQFHKRKRNISWNSGMSFQTYVKGYNNQTTQDIKESTSVSISFPTNTNTFDRQFSSNIGWMQDKNDKIL